MGDEDFDFQGGDAGASSTYPIQCSALRKNGFVMIKVKYIKVSVDILPNVMFYLHYMIIELQLLLIISLCELKAL